MTERTVTKTLWTESLIDDLCNALERGHSEAAVRSIARSLKGKGLPPRYLIMKVRHKLDNESAVRLKMILGGNGAGADSARARPRARLNRRVARPRSSLFGAFRRLFAR